MTGTVNQDTIREKIKNTRQNIDSTKESVGEKKNKETDMTANAIKGKPSAGQSKEVYGNRSNSVENQVLKAFGIDHISKILHVNTAAKRYAGLDLKHIYGAQDVKEVIDIARFTAQICLEQKADEGAEDHYRPIRSILDTNYAKEVLIPLMKAFGTGVSGEGAEWLMTAVSTSYAPEFELDNRLVGMIREMPMPTNPFKLPVLTDVTVARRAVQGAALSGNNFKTKDITWTAEKFGEFYPLPEELNQDSMPPILQIARTEVGQAQIRAKETLALNADDSVTHMDADVTGTEDARTYSKGLRKLAIDNTLNGSVIDHNGPVAKGGLDKMRRAMGKFGVNVRDLAYINSPGGYFQGVELDEVTSVEKFGPAATILNGNLDAYRGIPWAISEYLRDDLNANGVHEGVPANDTKSANLLFNKSRFWYGMRQPIRIRVQLDLPNQDRYMLASYSRFDFKGHEQTDKEVSVAYGVNIDLTA